MRPSRICVWLETVAALASMAVMAAGVALLGNVHPAAANPAVTHSRYVGGSGSNTTTDFTNLGCARGAAGEVGAIILDFGQPAYISGSGYGTYVPGGSGQFMSLTDIRIRAQNFASGFYNCASGSAYVTMIIGTSNYGSQVNNGHGAEWAYMVDQVQDWITAPPSYASRIQAAGGSDIELDWNNYTTSAGWVQSFDSVNQQAMYNYGDAAGCPSTQSGNVTGQTATSLSCPNSQAGWTQQRVRYVSWGNSAAYPFPEIYTEGSPYSAQAIQWQRISNYSKRAYGSAMIISGVLTQRGACDDVGGSTACPGTYNSPNQGYDQLWNALNYLDSGYVAHSPQWLSDIDWQ